MSLSNGNMLAVGNTLFILVRLVQQSAEPFQQILKCLEQ